MQGKKELPSCSESYYKSLSEVLLSRDEEDYYASIIQDGDKDNPTDDMSDAVYIMWECNLRLVIKMVMNMLDELDGVSPDDAIAWGRIGLLTAVWKYKPDFDNKFSTYARHWILKAIRDKVNVNGHSGGYISISSSAAGKAKRVGAAKWKYISENGREPTKKELSEMTSIPEGSIAGADIVSRWKRTPVEHIGNEERFHDSGFDDIEIKDDLVHMRRAMSKLTKDEARVLILRKGLDGKEGLKLDDVGEVIGISGEGVRLMQERAMAKLRNIMQEKNDDVEEINYEELARR